MGHYRIIEKLGGGGMGVVSLAEETRLEGQVAIDFHWQLKPVASA